MPALFDTPRGIVVGRLRVTGDEDAGRRARLALERTAPDVPGLPAGAVLVVRRLADPLPGGIGRDPWRPDAGPAWTDSLAAALAAAARGAARPWDGPVPAACPAVLFGDRAEMLACLGRAAAAGGLGAWWWASLGPDRLTAARALWAREPFDVPPALMLLAPRGLAVPVARLLGPALCAALVSRVARAHAVHPDHLAPPPPAAAPATAPARPPAAVHVPEAADPDLPPEAARLLHVALLVTRHPAAARRPAAPPAAIAPPLRAASHRTPPPAAAADPPGPSPAAIPPPPPSQAGAREGAAATEMADWPRARPNGHPAGSPREVPPPGEPSANADVAEAGPAAPAVTAAPGDDDGHLATGAAIRPSGVDTAWAGVLFLVNAFLRLGLYADLGGGWAPNGDRTGGAGLWDLVAIVGEDLAGPDVEGDPLWPLVAALAGRDDGAPPAIAGPAGRRALLVGAVGAWVTRRLAAVDPAAGVRTLLARPGRVAVTAGRVDATFALDDHPFAIRAAGLDRDPGPVPAAGRWIAFTFT